MFGRRRIEGGDEQTEINLSPMIDCIFILLIFFIVTTVFVESPEVDIVKPYAATAERLEKNSIIFAISADNKVYYGGREVGIMGVGPIVKRLIRTNGDMPVIIQSDENASHGTYTRVHTEAKIAGAEQIANSVED